MKVITDNSNFHSQLEDVVEAEESDVRLEKQVDGSIAVTDYVSNQVLLEVWNDSRDVESKMEKAVSILQEIEDELHKEVNKSVEERIESRGWLSDARNDVNTSKKVLKEIKSHLEDVREDE